MKYRLLPRSGVDWGMADWPELVTIVTVNGGVQSQILEFRV